MTIYNKSKTALPYVYRCVERETGRFYIGYRFKNYVSAKEDFGVHYFTSNDYVKENFEKFDYEIIAEFPDRKSAFAYETQLIRETKCEKQINANKHNKSKKLYQESQVNLFCKLPGCEKYINSSIKKFCCQLHASQYAARKKHGTLFEKPKTLEQLKEYQVEYYKKNKEKIRERQKLYQLEKKKRQC
jgi:Rieske Fe-S protein